MPAGLADGFGVGSRLSFEKEYTPESGSPASSRWEELGMANTSMAGHGPMQTACKRALQLHYNCRGAVNLQRSPPVRDSPFSTRTSDWRYGEFEAIAFVPQRHEMVPSFVTKAGKQRIQ